MRADGVRLIRASLAAACVLAVAVLARADAPSDQYGLFNASSQVIQDVQTGLYWERYPTAGVVPFANAVTHCQGLSLQAGGSSTGWRLPSYKELLTIVDESPHTEYENGQLVSKAIDGNAFPGAPVSDADYWSSSPFPQPPPGSFYVVRFVDGRASNQLQTFTAHVRCVHD